MSFAIAEDFTLDESSNKFKSYAFLKGTVVSFKFESKIYLIEVGDIDFENDRVTVQWISPRLGTEILNLDEPINFDLDKDDEDDIKLTMTSHDKDVGINEDLDEGTAILMFEVLREPIVETTTTVTSTTTTTIEEDNTSVAGQDITGSLGKEPVDVGDYKNWIIYGVIALMLLLLIVTRKKITVFLKKIPKKKKVEKKEPKEHVACPTCGRDTVIGDKFCIGCGGKLPGKPKFCTKCGETIRTESKFCASCGTKI